MDIPAYVAEQLKSGKLEMSCEDPDAPENWPRNLFVWRSNLLGSYGKGHEYFLKHLLGTSNGVMGKDLGETGAQKPSEVAWHDDAPEGKLDLLVSDLFYAGSGRFSGSGTFWEELFYYSVGPVVGSVFGGAVLLWLYNRLRHRAIAGWNGRKLLYVMLVLGLGSGLVVNALLKEHLGRARPARTAVYGGQYPFTPLFVPTEHAGYSCTSGHAAAAFSLLAFGMVARRRRRLWFTGALLYGTAVGIARISAGGHFFSDVMGSLFIVYITAGVLYHFMFERREKGEGNGV